MGFKMDRFASCGNDYEHGFMAGCLSVVGNDKEVCNIAEDAGAQCTVEEIKLHAKFARCESCKLFAVLLVAVMPVPAHADSCYKDGYTTGRNGPFDQHRFASCGDSYQRGFMAGCLSVVGNDVEVCNLAEDAGQ